MKSHFMSARVDVYQKPNGRLPWGTTPMRMATENNWDTFKGSKSVNAHTVLKDMRKMEKPDTRKLVRVKVVTRFKEEYREIFENQKKILCYGIVHTLRADGVFYEIGEGPKGKAPKSKKLQKGKRVKSVEKMENEYKSVYLKNSSGVTLKYRIIRKKK